MAEAMNDAAVTLKLRVTDGRAAETERLANHNNTVSAHRVLGLLDDRRVLLAHVKEQGDELARLREEARLLKLDNVALREERDAAVVRVKEVELECAYVMQVIRQRDAARAEAAAHQAALARQVEAGAAARQVSECRARTIAELIRAIDNGDDECSFPHTLRRAASLTGAGGWGALDEAQRAEWVELLGRRADAIERALCL